MKMPDGAWDGRILSVVLGFVSELEQHLRENLLRARGLGRQIDAARLEAQPHPVDLHEIGEHIVCRGRGCIECHGTGVGRAEDGRPFRSPPPSVNPTHVYATDPQPPEGATGWGEPKAGDPFAAVPLLPPPRDPAEARQRVLELAADFADLGELLEQAGGSAVKLARELERMVGA